MGRLRCEIRLAEPKSVAVILDDKSHVGSQFDMTWNTLVVKRKRLGGWLLGSAGSASGRCGNCFPEVHETPNITRRHGLSFSQVEVGHGKD